MRFVCGKMELGQRVICCGGVKSESGGEGDDKNGPGSKDSVVERVG